MLTYISGPIPEELTTETRQAFAEAERYLTATGRKPVNPLNGISNQQSPLKNFAERMRLLSDCSAIFLLEGWHMDPDATFEKFFAQRHGLEMIYQKIERSDRRRTACECTIVAKVSGAIKEAYGLEISEYTRKDRANKGYFARMIFSVHCHRAGMAPERINIYIPRCKDVVRRYLRRYPDELMTNRDFRSVAEAVEILLCEAATGDIPECQREEVNA